MEIAREMTFEEEAKFYEKEAIAEFTKETGDGDGGGVNNILRRGMRIIRKARQEIASREVVHGRWVDTGETFEDEKCRYNYWECSECNNQIAGRYGLHNYCPNCGAKMNGERKYNERKAD